MIKENSQFMNLENENYKKYRGKCKEYVEEAIKNDPTLIVVRGYYYCPIWDSKEPHWWCKRPDGTIYDPTALQFPSEGHGEYEEFNGKIKCAYEQCGKEITEDKAIIMGNYAVCSQKCAMNLVGLGEFYKGE